MEPQTWPKQAAFSLYSKFVKELIRQNNVGFGFPISGDSKQSLGLGQQIKEVTKVVISQPEFLVSGNKGGLLPPDTRNAPLT